MHCVAFTFARPAHQIEFDASFEFFRFQVRTVRSSASVVVEMTGVDTEVGPPKSMKAGSKVRVKGLINKSEYNGKIGTLTKFNLEKGRWGFHMDQGNGGLLVKPENLDIEVHGKFQDFQEQMKIKIQAEIDSVNQVQLSPVNLAHCHKDDIPHIKREHRNYRDFVDNHPFPSLERIMSYRSPTQRTNIIGEPMSNTLIDPEWVPVLERVGGLRYELLKMVYELGYTTEDPVTKKTMCSMKKLFKIGQILHDAGGFEYMQAHYYVLSYICTYQNVFEGITSPTGCPPDEVCGFYSFLGKAFDGAGDWIN